MQLLPVIVFQIGLQDFISCRVLAARMIFRLVCGCFLFSLLTLTILSIQSICHVKYKQKYMLNDMGR